MERSLVLPDVQVTNRETRNVKNHTGAVKSSVSMLPNLSVLTMVGKKYWKDWLSSEMC